MAALTALSARFIALRGAEAPRARTVPAARAAAGPEIPRAPLAQHPRAAAPARRVRAGAKAGKKGAAAAAPPNPPAGVSYGETNGAAMVVKGATIAVGPVELIRGIEWSVMPGDRWGLVGPNGAGKSTLLKALMGSENIRVADGSVAVQKGSRIGYLEQTAVSGSTATVREEVMSRMTRVLEARDFMESAQARVEGGDYSDGALQSLADSVQAFEDAGGLTLDERVARVLGGLGFSEADQGRSCADFSGGWQMRIALARLLLSEPELLVLDEPTNHLDAAARTWLAQYVGQYQGTVLVVSHDVSLLRKACTSIAEVRDSKLECYRTRTYDQWRTEREERQARLQAQYEAEQEEIARLQVRPGARPRGAGGAPR